MSRQKIAQNILVRVMKHDNFIGNAMDDLLDEIEQRLGFEGKDNKVAEVITEVDKWGNVAICMGAPSGMTVGNPVRVLVMKLEG